ncbi:MAG: exodeoxyribonuclease VII small subunit [Methanomicrobiales archaeon]
MDESYESLIEELRKIVALLEEGNAGLEESIRLYERGTEIVKRCERRLEEAELRITELSRE